MSKKKSDRSYQQTNSYKFFQWLQGEHDPYLDKVELHPQIEHKLSPEVMAERMEERKQLYDDIYALGRAKELKWVTRLYIVTCILVCIILLFVLIMVASHMPPTGVSTNPNNNQVSQRYVEQSLEETGSVNQVTAMITKYRAFDTLGETHVLFIATICVMILLLVKKEDNESVDKTSESEYDRILQINAYILIPMVFMFGIYIILNGHISPGGGFAGGSILGAGLILHTCAYGFQRTRRFFDTHIYKVVKITAVISYTLLMCIYFYTGANNIPWDIPLGTPGSILSAGIIVPVNILVGIEVACTMYAFYAYFRKGGL